MLHLEIVASLMGHLARMFIFILSDIFHLLTVTAVYTNETLALILVVLFSSILKVYNCFSSGPPLTAFLYIERT